MPICGDDNSLALITVCCLETRLRDAEATERGALSTTPPEPHQALPAVALESGGCRHCRRWSGWLGGCGDSSGARLNAAIIERGRVGSRGAAAMTVSTCTPFARCRISPATGFHVTSWSVGWHATSSFNTWSGTRRTIASSRGSGLRPRVLTATTTTGVFVRQLALFLRGGRGGHRVYPTSTFAAIAWHLRWTCSAFVDYRNPQPYRDQTCSLLAREQRYRDRRRSPAQGGARRVRIAVRTPPNILRARREGFPIQLLGIVFRRLPPRLLDPLILGLERVTIPDLSACGLPRPRAPFSQFQRTRTVPIFDVGFIDAVRNGAIEVVPGVTAFDGAAVVLADGSRMYPDVVVAATGYHPGLEPMVGHPTSIGEHGFPSPQSRLHFIDKRYQSPRSCMRLAQMPDRLQERWHCALACGHSAPPSRRVVNS